jgi:PKD repeat protein
MARIQILIAVTLGTLLFSCDNHQPHFLNEDALVADFHYQIEGDCSTPVLEVILENKSSKANAYHWNFGDGTTSNETNPKKIYSKSGNYTIKLTAYFSKDSIQIEQQISITRNSDGTGPHGQLSFTRNDTTNLELTFEIITEEPTYSLSFGDGTTISSNEKIVKHQYAGPGRYKALLTVQNSEGANCTTVTIDVEP